MREVLERIYRAGLDPVRPDRLIRNGVTVTGRRLRVAGWDGQIDLDTVRRIVVIGAGKASASMALALEDLLGDRIAGGTIATKAGHGEPLARIEVIESGHPVPDEESRRAARAVARHCRDADAGTLVIGLISGGGSALLAAPLETGGDLTGLDLDDKKRVTELLLACGATIQEMNCVRKHLSQVKGGRLAALIHPARSLNLILSDVTGDRLDTIASGLTAADCDHLRGRAGDHRPPRRDRCTAGEGRAGCSRPAATAACRRRPSRAPRSWPASTTCCLGSNLAALDAARAEARGAGLADAGAVLADRRRGARGGQGLPGDRLRRRTPRGGGLRPLLRDRRRRDDGHAARGTAPAAAARRWHWRS